MPEVSVIIPVYNSEKYVEKCICSVMAQTLPELEIIIINDGSIDESGKILRKLAQKDSRIILLEQENKQNRKRIKQLENLCKEKDSFFITWLIIT